VNAPVFVKVCGITSLADAQLAITCGAQALGFIFTASPRQVSALTVQKMTQNLPAQILKVGVFRAMAFAEIENIILQAGLTAVQIHGATDDGLFAQLAERHPEIVTIRVFEIDAHSHVDQSNGDVKAQAQQILFDVGRSEAVRLPLSISDMLTVRLPATFWIAGGLNAQNVRHYVERLRPAGVDVCSGVEEQPGRKSKSAMQDFFRALQDVQEGSLEKGSL